MYHRTDPAKRRPRVGRRLTAVLATMTAMLLVTTALAPLERAVAAASTASPRMVGVTLPGAPTDLTALNALTVELGRKPTTVMWYQQWAGQPSFPTQGVRQVAAWGATPEITWEPWDPSAGINQPSYSLARISSGAFDSYLNQWAKAARQWGYPLRLRFAHEMNGTWYPWAESVNGNAPGSYVKAWNHLREVFAKQGATNVSWIWSPNVSYAGSTPLSELFPGAANVDEVALDGYNWSTLQSWSTWTSFADVFNSSLGELRQLSSLPISIGEVGTPEIGGDKAQWITDMWSTLAAAPDIRGLVWFDFNKEADWRIDSSSASASAFSTGMTPYLNGPA
ncbi:Glycosyl hydrolase family 26 [Nakamurella panacisegetis]|uniref:Glycosyl hydrolase family 26 n=1 Tax=Nakamurella panacisegetis TaxID=1090615 RepID=A0A1H0RCG4_9ACTN|nr:glycosyl hydrolase [Nakamurella panacisegetis]SDP26859.1 Glycosyl hydrolase family 26 [Nakamurella panacisegetis]